VWTQEAIDRGFRARVIDEFQLLGMVAGGCINRPRRQALRVHRDRRQLPDRRAAAVAVGGGGGPGADRAAPRPVAAGGPWPSGSGPLAQVLHEAAIHDVGGAGHVVGVA
jgi:hypothetical protein